MRILGPGEWRHDLDGVAEEENRIKREDSLDPNLQELPIFAEQEEDESAKEKNPEN